MASTLFDEILKRFKNLNVVYPPITVDGSVDCIVDSVGNEACVDVYLDIWDRLLDALKKVSA